MVTTAARIVSDRVRMTSQTMSDDKPLPRAASVQDALFAPLPDEVRRRYGIGEYAPDPEPEKAAETSANPPARDAAPHGGRRIPTGDGADELPAPRADAPKNSWGMRFSDWKQVGKRTFRAISEDRVTSVAGGVTFFGILALFPAITAFVSIYGYFADPATIARHLEMLGAFIPEGGLEIIRSQVESIASAPKSALSIAGLVALGAALWSANGGMKALIDALNIAWFKRETRGFVRLNLVALTLTLGAIGMIIAMLGVIAVIPAVIAWVPMPDSVATLIEWVRWPLMFGVLIVALAALYRWGPNKDDTKLAFLTPGAVLAGIGLVVASYGFSFYASNFADYNATYGSIGAAIALMMWLWIASIVVLVGAELNSAADQQLRALHGLPPRDPE
ncbi:MAG: YihY/virulence factor BrkB family protein [Paracoccus sp. (in: a-proteobacteria)]|nr:YihY/virulence factor BrkB family protein [Paracoccus sp. (in: a-proteobacteria)]